MLTITPPPAPIIRSPNTWHPFQTPFTLTRITSSHWSSVTSRAGRWILVPALLTSTSTVPSSPAISSAAATTDARSPTSARKALARTPAAVSSSTTVLLAAASRATTAIVAPASPNAWAKARPRPRFPPVTTATLPSRRNLSRTVMPADCHRDGPREICGLVATAADDHEGADLVGSRFARRPWHDAQRQAEGTGGADRHDRPNGRD